MSCYLCTNQDLESKSDDSCGVARPLSISNIVSNMIKLHSVLMKQFEC